MNGEFSIGSDDLWLDVTTIGEDTHAAHRGTVMQHYFYDIHWDGEMLADDEGTSHFDDGSALYYGRTVANVRCGGADVASAQVRAGMAWVYTAYADGHPHLAPLQQQARASRAGLWSQPRPLAPWDYRHRHAAH